MKLVSILFFSLLASDVNAQEIAFSSKSFFAISTSNVDSVSTWYENVFSLKLQKKINTPDGNIAIRILGNDFLQIEIMQRKDAKGRAECNVPADQAYKIHGYFKTGLYVKDLKNAESYFKNKNVAIKIPIFEDKELKMRSFIIKDADGNTLQFIESE